MSSLPRRAVLAMCASFVVGCRPRRRHDVVKLGGEGALGFAVDDRGVYWTTGPSNGSLFRVAHRGESERVLVSGLHQASHLVVAGDWLYVALEDRVARILSSGGPLTTLARADRPFKLAVIGQEVRFIERAVGRLARVPIGGGPVETIADGLPSPVDLAVTKEATYVACDRDGVVFGCQPGKRPRTMVRDQLAIRDVLLVDGQLVWSSHAGVMAATPGAPPRRLVSTSKPPACLTSEDARIAWMAPAQAGGDRLWSLDLRGGQARPTGAAGWRAQQLALWHGQAFICDLATGRIVRQALV